MKRFADPVDPIVLFLMCAETHVSTAAKAHRRDKRFELSVTLPNSCKVYLHLLSGGRFEANDIFFCFALKLPNVDF